jgi:hypothetical protein
MMGHAKVRNALYEYVRNELPQSEREKVALHIGTCARCARDLERIATVIALLQTSDMLPSDERSPEFWNDFVSGIEKRIARKERANPLWRHIRDEVREFLFFRRRPVTVGLAAVAMLIAAFIIWRQPQSPEQAGSTENTVTPVQQSQERMNQYLRRSKALLVGLENMKTEPGHPLDLTAERKASRALVDEARFLKQQPLDMRSARLMNDVDKILIELANTDETRSSPRVEMIRGGIRQENLLFKIRMAENSARFIQAKTSSD